MIGVVLLQKSEGGGLGIGSTGGFMSSRGTANVLTRATAFLARPASPPAWCCRSWPAHDRKPRSIINTGAPAGQQAPGAPAPPGQGGGLLDTLRQQEQAGPGHSAAVAMIFRGPGDRPLRFWGSYV